MTNVKVDLRAILDANFHPALGQSFHDLFSVAEYVSVNYVTHDVPSTRIIVLAPVVGKAPRIGGVDVYLPPRTATINTGS